jgi:hypothetical protein
VLDPTNLIEFNKDAVDRADDKESDDIFIPVANDPFDAADAEALLFIKAINDKVDPETDIEDTLAVNFIRVDMLAFAVSTDTRFEPSWIPVFRAAFDVFDTAIRAENSRVIVVRFALDVAELDVIAFNLIADNNAPEDTDVELANPDVVIWVSNAPE